MLKLWWAWLKLQVHCLFHLQRQCSMRAYGKTTALWCECGKVFYKNFEAPEIEFWFDEYMKMDITQRRAYDRGNY